jgi:hypothetical protein
MNAEPTFFMIWHQGGASPAVAHPDYASARIEADRLAGKCPGARFTILQGIETVEGVVQIHARSLIKKGRKP